ncbi:pleiotropic drug resistance protein, partial [Striga asiatica]
MDVNNVHTASFSLRRSSSAWSNNGPELFSISAREEDDEEALKWAALEKLPTFDRLRKGLLFGSRGAANEVDVQNLGIQDRVNLLERLVKEDDNEKVGIELPTIEVRFENLKVETEAYVGSRALPSFMNFFTNILEEISSNILHMIPSKKKPLTILNSVSGIIKPGRMTLLLGPPSSGKTTLLLAMAGMLDPQLKAAAIEGQEASIVTDYVLKILGLDICADTVVGDEMIRGISGGQRKRVTTGEMLVGPAKALFMDEISTGLDSSTTFQVVNSIRQFVHIMKGTVLISLLQPEPETYDLFDDIILISEGQIVYEGPREFVLEFFQSMGFKCPERKGIADFLQEVTSKKDQQQYFADKDKCYRFITVKEFSEAFKSFHVGQGLTAEMAIPFDKKKSHPAALTTKEYGVSKKELMKACTSRELLLMRRNSFLYIFKLLQLSIMAVIAMTLFLRVKMHHHSLSDGRVFAGALFYAATTILFNGMAEIALTIQKLPVFYKQRNFFFYPGWAYALPLWITQIPVSIVEVGAFTILTYYGIGFDPNFGRFIKYFLLLLVEIQAASSVFRLIGAMGRNMIIANTFGFFVLLLVFALGGFVLSRDSIKKWWIWGYYISPMMYAQNAILVNEFRGHSWRHKVSPNSNITLGVEVLKSLGYFTSADWYWIGIGALLGMIIIFNVLSVIALTYLNPLGKPQAVLPENENEALTAQNGRADRKKRQVVLPFEPHSIVFDEVKYSVDMPQEMIHQGATEDRLLLLKGVSGAFRPGVLTALMGVSGAGKTTLMDVLAGRKTGGYIEGTITISGYPKRQETFARISGYCEQNDIHSPCVTVYEALLFSAWLRLPSEVDAETRKLFLMKRGGQEIYVGPVGRHSCKLIQYFESIQGVKKIRDGYNPATWMLEVTSSAQEMILGVDFAEFYKNSELYRRNKALISELSTPPPGSKDLHFETQYSQSFFTQCIACLWKQHWSYWRNPLYSAVRILYTAFLALLFGSMFWDLGKKLVDIQLPTIEVRFEHLNVGAEAYLGSRSLPTFFNFTINIFQRFLNYLHLLPSKKKQISILQDVSGIIKPCRMTLLLGPPSSGKTTLLLALAGKLDNSLKFSGSVSYNGHKLNEFVPQRTAAYISQHDVHIGEMTVRETLEFSARCQGIGSRYEMLSELSRREKNASIKPDPDVDIFMKAVATEGQEASVITDYIIKVLGLEVCADTMVGDELVRGISGGQRKRVTTGEMLVGPTNALFMDEISTGLDSSTTYQIVSSLRQYVHILNGTSLISLLQPAPETYELFDDIILLSDGQIVYQGPRDNVLEFFESVGFKCPERKGVADFLQEVTSQKDQEQYWTRAHEPYRFVTVSEFVEAFQSFHVGKSMRGELAAPFDKSKSHQAALTTKKYGTGIKELMKACYSRELLLIKRNSFVYVFKILVVSMTIYKLPIFYKQRDSLFFPPCVYSIPTWLLKIPISFVEVGVWVFITYYGIGYDPSVARLFKQYLILFLLNQMASGLFRVIGAVGRSLVIANTFGAFVALFCHELTMFVFLADDAVDVKKWWIGGYWSSPIMYAQNAIVENEFTGNAWKHVVGNTTETLGHAVLRTKGFLTQANFYWIGVGALLGFIILSNLGFMLALTHLNPFGNGRAVEQEDSDNNQNDHKTEVNQQITANQKKNKGMVLPFEPHSITFDEIVYSVDMPQGVSGAFRPGVLTALMGVSGAGKTTLMDVLAGRKTGGYIDGNITISGYPKKQETFARISGYCEQDDIHSPHVTVHESLLFSAWLRLSPDVDVKTKKMFVEEVMELVELTNLRGALVGLPGINGLSTEQRKRLTIAVELVANPSIIFMDEPTSGLDARAAAIVMRTVRNTVDTGRTVVCTIHQPSIDIFEAFDELLLLKRGGEEIYVGPLGHHSCDLIKYFEGIQGVHKIKDGYNPATWMLEVTAPVQEMALGIDFAQVYKNSRLYRRTKTLIRELTTPNSGKQELSFPSRYCQPFHMQCIACLWKQYWSYWRNPSYTAVRFLFTTFVGLIFGSIFYILLLLWFLQFKHIFPPTFIFNYVQELSSLVSLTLEVAIEFPYILAQASVYGIIVYAMIGFEWTAAKFFWYIFFMYFTLLYFTFYGMMCLAMAPNHHIAAIISGGCTTLWTLFSGFIIPRPKIPIWWRWYYWATPVSWTLYGLAASQYGDVESYMFPGITVKEVMKSYYGFRHDFLGVVAAVTVAFAFLFIFMFGSDDDIRFVVLVSKTHSSLETIVFQLPIMIFLNMDYEINFKNPTRSTRIVSDLASNETKQFDLRLLLKGTITL